MFHYMYCLTSLHTLRFGIQFYTFFSNIPDQRSEKKKSGPLVHYIHHLTGIVSVKKCGSGKLRRIFKFKMFRHEPLTVVKFRYPWMVTYSIRHLRDNNATTFKF